MPLVLNTREGSTYRKRIRLECEPFVYRPITSISRTAPCELHIPDHGVLANQLFCVEHVAGMKEINSATPADLSSWYRATVVSPDILQINKINSSQFSTHSPGTGFIRYRSLVDLTGCTARLSLRKKRGSIPNDILTTEDGRIRIDTATHEIVFTIGDEDFVKYPWKEGLFDLDLILPSSDIYTIATGIITIEKE